MLEAFGCQQSKLSLEIQADLTLLSGSLVLFPLPSWTLGIVQKQDKYPAGLMHLSII